MGYFDPEDQPIGAGKHLIPMLLETYRATKMISAHGLEVFQLEEDKETSIDPDEVIESFYEEICKTVQALQENGYDNAADMLFELIFPHMDFIFCIHYACWSAMMNPIDVAFYNLKIFDVDNPNRIEDTLRAFLQVAQEKEAKWSIKITEKALWPYGSQ